MNKVKVGFFSFTEITRPDQHRAYNEWHQYDHMPEQYPLPGLAHGQRWVSTPACRAVRLADTEPLSAIHYLTLYLMTDPVETTLSDFMELGQRLHSLGRFHQHRRAHLSGALQLLSAAAAPRVLISPEAVPWRPHRGVYAIVEAPSGSAGLDHHVQWEHEQHIPKLLGVDGVAGVWTFASSPGYAGARWDPGRHRITLCWLDGDPVTTAGALAPVVAERWEDGAVRPELAGPFEVVVPGRWDWFDR